MKSDTFPSYTVSGTNYILRPAVLEDAFEIWSVMDYCSRNMENKDHFICDDLPYVTSLLQSHGFAVVACDNSGKIVGNLLVKYPGTDAGNLGYDVFCPNLSANCGSLPSSDASSATQVFSHRTGNKIALIPENLNKVVHMDSASVLPNHRGHRLERHMLFYAETLIDKSNYAYAFATVAPENTASLKSLTICGYKQMVTKEKYNNVVRCIMMKRL